MRLSPLGQQPRRVQADFLEGVPGDQGAFPYFVVVSFTRRRRGGTRGATPGS